MKSILSLIVFFALGLSAAEFESPAATEFKPLFNGLDLTGWVPVNIAPETFRAEDGVLITTGQPIGMLRTEKMVENFILELEWRHLKAGGNSGVFVWGDALPGIGSPFPRGIECQVLDPGFDVKGKNQWYTTHGDLFPVNGATMTVAGNISPDGKRSFPSEERTKPSPEWNHYRLTGQDGNLTLAVNGKVVTIAKNASPRKGYLMLESEGSEIHFRNLKIHELPSTLPQGGKSAPFIAEADPGFRPIFTGLDLRGWKISEGSDDTWQVANGVLVARHESDQRSAITTEIPAATCELVADYQLSGNATAMIGETEVNATDNQWRRHRMIVVGKPVGIPTRSLKISIQGKGTLRLRNLFIRELPEQSAGE